jgi:hypothetical protein
MNPETDGSMSMPTSTNTNNECAIVRIQADDAGLDFYLRVYKPFRLNALLLDPHGMSSSAGSTAQLGSTLAGRIERLLIYRAS